MLSPGRSFFLWSQLYRIDIGPVWIGAGQRDVMMPKIRAVTWGTVEKAHLTGWQSPAGRGLVFPGTGGQMSYRIPKAGWRLAGGNWIGPLLFVLMVARLLAMLDRRKDSFVNE
jgi:hypothetical protein